jgi:uncharacterized membrane protein (UPF0127 family)
MSRRWIVALTVLLALSAGIGYWLQRPAKITDIWESPAYATRQLRAGDKTFTVQLADSADKQRLGLSNRVDIPPDRGMLFTYDAAAADRCFWMKDMNFPIDIIWLDAKKRVVHIEAEVSPDTYPKTFCPDGPAQYVVELHPGTAGRNGLTKGLTLSF